MIFSAYTASDCFPLFDCMTCMGLPFCLKRNSKDNFYHNVYPFNLQSAMIFELHLLLVVLRRLVPQYSESYMSKVRVKKLGKRCDNLKSKPRHMARYDTHGPIRELPPSKIYT